MVEQYVIFTDGSADNFIKLNFGWGFVAYRNDELIHQSNNKKEFTSKGLEATNNYAEYYAVFKALNWILESKIDGNITFKIDSALVVNQINGNWKVKSDNIKTIYKECLQLIKEIEGTDNYKKRIIKFIQIPRKLNKKADGLASNGRRKSSSI